MINCTSRISRTAAQIACFSLMSSVAIAAPPNQCSPFPVTVTIEPQLADGTPSRILPDAGGIYSSGVGGVEAVIHGCPGGTGDMTLKLGTGKKGTPARSFTLDLTSNIWSHPEMPSWADDVLVMSGGLTVGNVMWNYQAGQSYSFTTGLAGGGFPNPNYYLRTPNPSKDTGPLTDYQVNANNPCDAQLVRVTHYPATGTEKETWVVTSDPTPTNCTSTYDNPVYVSAIVDSRTGWSSVAQARLPFRITIRRK